MPPSSRKRPAAEEAILKTYPPPKKGKEFQRYWEPLILNVAQRQNFKEDHLFQVATLCGLYVEKDRLEEIISTEGAFYFTSGGRSGDIHKQRPEVDRLSTVTNQILYFTKALGLVLHKDTQTKLNEAEEEWE
jgi:hypothetical protein